VDTAVEALHRNIHPNEPIPDFFNKLGDVSKNIVVQVAVIAPLLLRNHGSLDKNPIPFPCRPFVVLLVVLLVDQVRVKLVPPLFKDSQQQDAVTVPLLVIQTLELC
jgi:hypothetical protein